MTGLTRSPKIIKGGIVLIDPNSGAVLRIIALQYNPDTLTRTLQVQAVGGEGDRLEALRLKGPPVETIKLDAEIDATDQLELRTRTAPRRSSAYFPQLAALETIVYPTSAQLESSQQPRAGRDAGDLAGRSRRCRCSSGARRGFCRCASRSSASPKRRSTSR